MDNGKRVLMRIANTGALSLLPIAAMAGSPPSVALEQKVQENVERQLAEKGNQYSRIVMLAGNRRDELAARKDDAINAYRKWRDLTHAVVSRSPGANDYKTVAAAVNAYWNANDAFVGLQKRIIAENGARLDTVSVKTLYTLAQTAIDVK